MSYRLLKFDIIHPKSYLDKKKKEWDDLDELSAAEYRDRLIGLKSNYSDFYTYYLNEMGWEAEEFFLMDATYLHKLGKELFHDKYLYKKIKSKVLGKIRPLQFGWEKEVIDAYIKKFKPDVIFARSQPVPSEFWQRYRNECLIVSRLSARLPRHWHPDDWDIIYTDLKVFKDFFEAHGVKTFVNKQGFDPRINDKLIERKKIHEVVFVGGMGTENFYKRTKFFEKIAAEINFKWWGYWWEYGGWGSLDNFPNLKKSFQGPISGLEMYQLYKDSKIILNDYVDTSKGIGYNQRMFEIMGVGGFMLTREASNFKTQFPSNLFETFESPEDCIKKINVLLQNEAKREETGKRAQAYVKQNYHYRDIVREFNNDLLEVLD